jgi:hypothetical protein
MQLRDVIEPEPRTERAESFHLGALAGDGQPCLAARQHRRKLAQKQGMALSAIERTDRDEQRRAPRIMP